MLICTSHGWIDAAEPAAVFQKSKAAGQPILCLANGSDLPALQPFTGMSDRILAECATGGGIKFESHEGFDFIALEIPGQADSGAGKARVFLYFRPNLLLFGCGDPNVDPLLQDLRAQVDQSLSESGVLSLEKTLQQFFDRLTAKDMALLSLIEEEAAGVEERLLGSRSPELSPTILALRKRLLAYERYYSRLSLVSAAIEATQSIRRACLTKSGAVTPAITAGATFGWFMWSSESKWSICPPRRAQRARRRSRRGAMGIARAPPLRPRRETRPPRRRASRHAASP